MDCTSPSRTCRGGAAAPIVVGLAGLALLPGCFAFYGHRAVTAQVVDGDTSAPVPGAVVTVRSNASYLTLNAPDPVAATTDEGGLATLRIAEHLPVLWHVSKPGYEAQTQQASHEIVPPEFPRDQRHRVRIAIFAPPPPEIIVVVPDGHRGPVAVAIARAPAGPAPAPGLRTLELAASPEGIVAGGVPGPFNLVDETCPRIRVRFASGDDLVATASDVHEPDEVRQRQVFVLCTQDATKALYVVGTSAEAMAVARDIEPVTVRDGRSSRRFDPGAFARYFGEPPPSKVD